MLSWRIYKRICVEKSQETIELLELNQGNIHVGQYLTQMPLKELLEEKNTWQLKIKVNVGYPKRTIDGDGLEEVQSKWLNDGSDTY